MQIPGIQTINASEEKDVVKKLKSMTSSTNGPDVGIEAVGNHYTKSTVHKVETAVGMETDQGDTLNEIIKAVRKVGLCCHSRGFFVKAYFGLLHI